MAQNAEANILVTIKEKGKEVLTGIGASFNALIKGAAAVATALAAVGVAIGKLALDAAEFGEIENAFRRLAVSQGANADQILKKMKEASDGVLSQAQMIKAANEALFAGIPIDRLAEITKIAKAAADATGESVENMMNSITSGLARGSTMMLRHAGIVFDAEAVYEKYAKSIGKSVSQLTDAQKKQVFLNEALNVGQKTLENLGEGQLSIADKWDRVKAISADLTMQIGKEAIPAFDKLLDVFLGMATAIEKIGIRQLFMDFQMGFIEARARMEEITDWFVAPFRNVIAYAKAAKEAVVGNFGAAKKILDDISKQEIMGGKSFDILVRAEEDKQKIREKYRSEDLKEEVIKEEEKKEAAVNKEKIKQKEISDVREEWERKNVMTDMEMFAEHQKIKASMEERALAERVRMREVADRQETLNLEKMAKIQAENIGLVSSSVQTFASAGLEGLATKAAGIFADTLVPGIGGAVSQVVQIFSQNADQFNETLNKLFDTDFLSNIGQNYVTYLNKLPGIIENIIGFIADNIPAIMENVIAAIIGSMPEIISAFGKGMVESVLSGAMLSAIAKGFAAGISDAAGDIGNALRKAGSQAAYGMQETLTNSGEFFRILGTQISGGVRDGLTASRDFLAGLGKDVVQGIIDSSTTASAAMQKLGADMLNALTTEEGWRKVGITISDSLRKSLSDTVNFAKGLDDTFKYLGGQIASGFKQAVLASVDTLKDFGGSIAVGFKRQLEDVTAFSKSIGGAVSGAFKTAIDQLTASAKGLGGDIAEGFKQGIKEIGDVGGKTGGDISRALKGLVSNVSGLFGGYHGGLIPGYASGGLIDNQLIRATAGEFMVNKDSASANLGLLNSINDSRGRSVNASPTIVVNVNGGLLGDRESARMLAIAIDQELYRLRQGNESRAFDRSIS